MNPTVKRYALQLTLDLHSLDSFAETIRSIVQTSMFTPLYLSLYSISHNSQCQFTICASLRYELVHPTFATTPRVKEHGTLKIRRRRSVGHLLHSTSMSIVRLD
jgi:hypothetical protein